jgi:hypothetical protein
MQAPSRISHDPRLRAVAALVACLLAVSLSTAAHASTQKQLHHALHRGVVAAALAVTDSPTGPLRTDQPVAAAGIPTATALAHAAGRTTVSSGSVSATTVQAPQVRGPPLEAAA